MAEEFINLGTEETLDFLIQHEKDYFSVVSLKLQFPLAVINDVLLELGVSATTVLGTETTIVTFYNVTGALLVNMGVKLYDKVSARADEGK